jgi:F-type H+-transporting ATPase subunit epsilon
MKLKVLIPSSVVVDTEVTKVTAEAANGSFCLLPKHVDFVAGLVPGILQYETEAGEEKFLGTSEGVLVKAGSEVLVSTGNAVDGPDLGTLTDRIREELAVLDQREKKARVAASKLEASLVRRFMETQKG